MTRRVVGLVVAAVLVVAGCSSGQGAASPSAGPSGAGAASEAPSASAPGGETAPPTATTAPTSTPVAGEPTCRADQLAARITGWDSGAGHRTASVEVTNSGSSPCRMKALDRPQLVDGHGSVLIDGAAPAASSYVTMSAGAVLKTMVDVANYCGPSPVAPVTVAFVFPGGAVRFVATALSPTDLDGVPPCLGAPGSAGSISMHAWAP